MSSKTEKMFYLFSVIMCFLATTFLVAALIVATMFIIALIIVVFSVSSLLITALLVSVDKTKYALRKVKKIDEKIAKKAAKESAEKAEKLLAQKVASDKASKEAWRQEWAFHASRNQLLFLKTKVSNVEENQSCDVEEIKCLLSSIMKIECLGWSSLEILRNELVWRLRIGLTIKVRSNY